MDWRGVAANGLPLSWDAVPRLFCEALVKTCVAWASCLCAGVIGAALQHPLTVLQWHDLCQMYGTRASYGGQDVTCKHDTNREHGRTAEMTLLMIGFDGKRSVDI